MAERRELKLARLKQLMQRSLSESDSDVYPPDDASAAPKHTPGGAPPPPPPRPERPNQLPVGGGVGGVGDETAMPPAPPGGPAGLYALMKKHHHPHPHPHPHSAQGSTAERKLSFALRTSRSMDAPDLDPAMLSDFMDGDADPGSDAASGQKANTTSPKSALKSPSSRRKTAQNLKLRVTFDEPVVHKEATEAEGRGGEKSAAGNGSSGGGGRASESGGGETWKRPFGTFRSIMETLSGNQNSNNNNVQSPGAAGSPQGPTGKKVDSKVAGGAGSPQGLAGKKVDGKVLVSRGRSKPSVV